MYIIKNALKSIGRSKGRNALIGLIALVIATSACIGLSIRQAAESAKSSTLQGMSVTATISYDRTGAMNNIGQMGSGGIPSFDKDMFADLIGGRSSMTLEEYQIYAAAESVQNFYYTLTAYVNGSESFLPVSDSGSSDSADDSGNGFFPGNFGDMFGGGMSTGEFTIVGYSSDSAMTGIIDGTMSILEGGQLFEEGTSEYVCVISEELALYNTLSVGDTIVITNPTSETETYTLTISGIYSSTESNDFSMSMFGSSQDPANQIYMSANALQAILDASEAFVADSEETDDSETAEVDPLTASLSATYAFADTDDYYAFEEEARTLGLADEYTISSSDLTAFENSLTPLKTLSSMAGGFLLVILLIGGVILVVLNIFNVRERKYEVGVLTAMGMKKSKVAAQFVCEILVVTMVAVLIGATVGAVGSVPVTNALLAEQAQSQNSQQDKLEQSMGRPGNFGDMFGSGGMPNMPNMPNSSGDSDFSNIFNSAADYITQVDSAMNLTVVLQMIGVGLLLTLIASAASVMFVMRYDPLKILANRD